MLHHIIFTIPQPDLLRKQTPMSLHLKQARHVDKTRLKRFRRAFQIYGFKFPYRIFVSTEKSGVYVTEMNTEFSLSHILTISVWLFKSNFTYIQLLIVCIQSVVFYSAACIYIYVPHQKRGGNVIMNVVQQPLLLRIAVIVLLLGSMVGSHVDKIINGIMTLYPTLQVQEQQLRSSL